MAAALQGSSSLVAAASSLSSVSSNLHGKTLKQCCYPPSQKRNSRQGAALWTWKASVCKEENPTARIFGETSKQSAKLCSEHSSQQPQCPSNLSSRRVLLLSLSAAAAGLQASLPNEALAISATRRALREKKVKEEDFTVLPNGLKYYDFTAGSGPEADMGARVTVHFDCKWKGITFQTSRQGMGVTGGTPYGFNVGTSERGMVLKGLDLGVYGMRVGGERLLVVPPELAYGSRGVGEIPPNATIEISVQLLSVKQNAFGTPVKLIEG